MNSNLRRPTRTRLLLVVGVALYVACFRWFYVSYLVPEWDYMGFELDSVPFVYTCFSWVLSILPSLWMPISLQRASQLAYWVLYLIVIIPSMIIPLYSHLNSFSEIAVLMAVLFVGFVIVGTGYRFPVLRIKEIRLTRTVFWTCFAAFSSFLAVWILVVFRHTLTLVSFRDVYDVRFAADDLIEHSFVNYPLMWLPGAVDPFLMGFGLYYRKRWLVVAGVLGQFLVYASMGTKGSVSSIAFILAFYFALRKEGRAFALRLTWGIGAGLLGLCSAYLFCGEALGPIFTTATSLILMRTLGIPGLMTAQYYDFFQRNPFTYYSTVTGVNWFIPYPYVNPLGNEVGYFYSGDRTNDAITHFWASDGIAALGLPGILLISVLCALVFWTFDSLAQKHDVRFAALVTCYAAYNVSNIPLFTSLLSGGMGLLALTLYLLPRMDSGIRDAHLLYAGS